MTESRGTIIRQKINDEQLQIVTAEQQIKDGLNALLMARETLAKCLEDAVDVSIAELAAPSVAVSTQRHEHTAGRAAVLDTDPVLRAFVIARFNRMTFSDIAAEVKANFPEGQRIGKSAIHQWWRRNYK